MIKIKTLMILVLIPIFSIGAFNSDVYAQKKNKQKCRYNEDFIDKFSNLRNVTTDQEKIWEKKKGALKVLLAVGSRVGISVYGASINGSNSLGFMWYSDYYGFVKNFNQIEILMENDEIIKLYETESSKIVNLYPNESSYKIFAIENDSIWMKLKSIPLVTIRLSLNGDVLAQAEPDKGKESSIMKVINCIDILEIPKIVRKMSSDEALAELKKAKDKFDLELLTQDEYDTIKATLSKYIK